MVPESIRTRRPSVVTAVAAATRFGVGSAPFFAGLDGGLGKARDLTEESGGFPPIERDVSQLLRKVRTDHELTVQLLAAVELDLGARIEALSAEERERVGVAIGNAYGNETALASFYATGSREGYRAVNPVHFPETMLNFPAAQLSNAFELTGGNTTVGSGSTAGLEAIAYADVRLRLEREEVAIAGGIEGTRLGGAAGIGLLWLEDGAKAGNGALARILGHAALKSAPGDPPESTKVRASETLLAAIESAGLGAADVDAVFPSFSSPEHEVALLRAVFGARLGALPVYPIRDLVGDCFAASGALQTLAAIHAMNDGAETRDGRTTTIEGEVLLLPGRIGRCEHPLVYTSGSEHSTAALVLGSAST